MSTKQWLLGACGGALVAGAMAVPTADASMIVDLQLTAVNGVPQTGKGPVTVKVGDVLSVNIIAQVRGTNSTVNTDGLQSLSGTLFSSGPGAVGQFVATGDDILDVNGDPTGQKFFAQAPFADNGTQNGAAHDVKAGGGLDIGQAVDDGLSGAGDYLLIRAASAQKGKGDHRSPVGEGSAGAGLDFTAGSFDWKVTGQGAGTETLLGFEPRIGTDGSVQASSALWIEDNLSKTGTSKNSAGAPLLTSGAPIIVNIAPIPEPGTVLALGLGAVGLMTRIRRR
jgi:hypothetical protein